MTQPVMYFLLMDPLVHMWLGKYDEVTVMARIGGWFMYCVCIIYNIVRMYDKVYFYMQFSYYMAPISILSTTMRTLSLGYRYNHNIKFSLHIPYVSSLVYGSILFWWCSVSFLYLYIASLLNVNLYTILFMVTVMLNTSWICNHLTPTWTM